MEITKKAREKAQSIIDKERIKEKPSSVDEIITMVKNEVGHIAKKDRQHIIASNFMSVAKAYKFKKNYLRWEVQFNKKGDINQINICREEARPIGEESYIHLRIKDIEKIIPNYHKLTLEEKITVDRAVTYMLVNKGDLPIKNA